MLKQKLTAIFLLICLTSQVLSRCGEGVDGCDSCAGADRCVRCREGYVLQGGECYSCLIDGCGRCTFSGRFGECITCKNGYFEAKNERDEIRCKRCTAGCQKCDNTETCIQCYPLHNKDSLGKCKLDSGVAVIALGLIFILPIGCSIACAIFVCFAVFQSSCGKNGKKGKNIYQEQRKKELKKRQKQQHQQQVQIQANFSPMQNMNPGYQVQNQYAAPIHPAGFNMGVQGQGFQQQAYIPPPLQQQSPFIPNQGHQPFVPPQNYY